MESYVDYIEYDARARSIEQTAHKENYEWAPIVLLKYCPSLHPSLTNRVKGETTVRRNEIKLDKFHHNN